MAMAMVGVRVGVGIGIGVKALIVLVWFLSMLASFLVTGVVIVSHFLHGGNRHV